VVNNDGEQKQTKIYSINTTSRKARTEKILYMWKTTKSTVIGMFVVVRRQMEERPRARERETLKFEKSVVQESRAERKDESTDGERGGGNSRRVEMTRLETNGQ